MGKRSNKLNYAIILANLALWSYWAFEYLARPEYTIILEPPISSSQQVESEIGNLVVNISDTTRTIVHKNEAEGIKDLQSLVTAAYEESWLIHHQIPDGLNWGLLVLTTDKY